MRRFEHAAFFRIADGYAGHTAVIALFERGSLAEQDRSTLDHLAVTISHEDYEPQKQRLEELGLTVETANHTWVHWRSLYIRDPEGNTVEFVCYDPTV
jgi:catechol 2,3-dioxygenase-like lactoylglutathione lyase family enzyme